MFCIVMVVRVNVFIVIVVRVIVLCCNSGMCTGFFQ